MNYLNPAIIQEILGNLCFSTEGLIPAIAQQHDSGEVLMLAWMNADSLRKTLETSQVHYWSRSRRCLWKKGETSGHIQTLLEMRWDCDQDALLLLIDQQGPACHTKRRSCFFNALRDEKIQVIADPLPESK